MFTNLLFNLTRTITYEMTGTGKSIVECPMR